MPPDVHATIKLHKQNTPIRPIINWKHAFAYELAKYLKQILYNHLHLPYVYNIRHSVHLITDLQNIEISDNIRMCSFNIKNMYINIPKLDNINIINNTLNMNPEKK
jgi:hypothetical protein